MALLMGIMLSTGMDTASAQTAPTTPTNSEVRASETAANQAARAAETARLNAAAAAQRAADTGGNAGVRAADTAANQAQRAAETAQRAQQLNQYRDKEEDKRGDRALRRDLKVIGNRVLTNTIVEVAKDQGRMEADDARLDAKIQQREQANDGKDKLRDLETQEMGTNCAVDSQGNVLNRTETYTVTVRGADGRTTTQQRTRLVRDCAEGTLASDEAENAATRATNSQKYLDAAQQRHDAEIQGLLSRGGERGKDLPTRPSVAGEGAVVATKLSDSINNFGRNLVRFPSMFYIMSYVCGVFFLAMSLSKANKAVLNPSQNPISDAFKYGMAGVFLMSLPMTTDMLHDSLGFGGGNLDLNYAAGIAEAKKDTNLGLDSFMINLVTDITTPMLKVVSLFAFAAGVFLIFTGLKRLVKGSQEGPKGPAGLGTIMTFVVGAALISFVPSIQVFLTTMFGQSTVMTFPVMTNVSSGLGLDPSAIAHSQAVFTSLLAFLGIIGVISFARGLFMMRDVADGAQNASLMGSMSHMIAGVCCVNFGAVANLLQNTLGLANLGVTFQ